MALFSKPQCLEDTCHEILHTWTPSCTQAHSEMLCSSFKSSLIIYATFDLAMHLARKREIPQLSSYARNVLRSSVFLSLVSTLPVVFSCWSRLFLKKFYFLTVIFVPGILAGFAIFVERKSQRLPMALFSTSVAFESIIKSLINHGLIPDIKDFEMYIFSVASAFVMYLYRTDQLHGFSRSTIRFLLQENTPSMINSRALSPAVMKQWAMSSGNAFISAYVVRNLVSLISNVGYWIRRPSHILRILKSKSNLGFGAFIGSYVFIFKVSEFLLGKIRQGQKESNAFIAGGIAGLAMMFHKSYGIATSSLVRVLELLIERRYRNSSIARFPHYDALLYAVAVGFCVHFVTIEPHSAPAGYCKLLAKLSGGRTHLCNRKKLDHFGCESSKLYPKGNFEQSEFEG